MSKLKFYSAEEVQTLTNELNSGKKVAVIAREYSTKFDRPIFGLEAKLHDIRSGLKKSVSTIKVVKTKKRGRPAKGVQPAKIEAGVELPSGFVFDFQPKKAEMYANHVRLYF